MAPECLFSMRNTKIKDILQVNSRTLRILLNSGDDLNSLEMCICDIPN